MSFWTEFREFAVKGNAIDMAVGIIIGNAFNKIVNSIVSDLVMPPIGYMINGVDFKNLAVVLAPASTDPAGKAIPEVAIHYGMFLNSLVEFAIVSLSVFVAVKCMTRVMALRVGPVTKEVVVVEEKAADKPV